MRIASVKATRIILTREDISIDGVMMIEPDDPAGDMVRQHIPSTSRVDELPAPMQAAINNLFALCDLRVARGRVAVAPSAGAPPAPNP